MTLAKRIFAITVLIFAAALAGLTLLVSAHTTSMVRELSLDRLSDGVGREARLLQTGIDLLKGDVLFLAAADVIGPLAESGTPGATPDSAEVRRLARIFETVMRQRPAYTQVRLVGLSDNGREIVRVNRDGDRIAVVEPKDMQQKGDRPYLHEATRIDRGEIHISRVDLNREHGGIAQPLQPVFRVATPVFDRAGAVAGAVIVNIDFPAFLGELGPSSRDMVYFVANENGDYLRHPDKSREFAFEFGGSARATDDYLSADTWRAWLSGSEPHRGYLPGRREAVVLDRVALPDASTDEPRFLVLGAVASLAALEAEALAFRGRLVFLALAVGAAAAAAFSLAAAHFTRPIEAITESARRISAGERDVALPAHGPGEVVVLSRALAAMLDSLRTAAKTEELAAMGRMASMIAHDLRNSLSAVKMNLQIVSRRWTSDETAQAHCRIGLDQVQHMERVVADMLIFARPERLKLDLLDVEEVLAATLASVSPQAEAKRLQVMTSFSDEVPRILGDRTKLVRAVQNVLENAIQASPEGGGVTLDLEPAETPAGAGVRIIVADEGPGITAETLPRIFEPFFTTKTKGTGLGLAIVERAARKHGGRVEVQSRDGNGTTVSLVLPPAPPSA